MAARWLWVVLLIGLSACTVSNQSEVSRVVLLAPFEGRYREVGYDMLYASRLALADKGYVHVELLPVDDGGTVEKARQRVLALRRNPSVQAVLVAGYSATAPEVLSEFGDLPVVVIGGWGAQPETDQTFILSDINATENYTVEPRISLMDAVDEADTVVGGEIFTLRQFPILRDDLTGVEVRMSAKIPDQEFIERYLTVDPFVEAPGALTLLGYDAAAIVFDAVAEYKSRAAVAERLSSGVFDGLSGAISFENGYWWRAPAWSYRYNAEGTLVQVDED